MPNQPHLKHPLPTRRLRALLRNKLRIWWMGRILHRLPSALITFLFFTDICFAQYELELINRKFFKTEDFKRLPELFTGKEYFGSYVCCRSTPSSREGFYFVVTFKGQGEILPSGSHWLIDWVHSSVSGVDSRKIAIADPKLFGKEVYIGLTGQDWVDPAEIPIAWRISLVDGNGDVLSTHKSFLWSDRERMRWKDKSVPWKLIEVKGSISKEGIEETLLGGQSFCWRSCGENTWTGVISRSVVDLKWCDGKLYWCKQYGAPITKKKLTQYLWLDNSYLKAVDDLPWRSDVVLGRAIKQFRGLRLLRQPIEEVLMVFLLSSAKSIPQINQLRINIHRLIGEDLGGGNHAFPGWNKLSQLSEQDARKLGMGYRAKYLVGTAQFLKDRLGWLNEVKESPYEEAKIRLMELPGVGPKVADCVLLFGGGKTEAFPIDTWILQSLEKQYGFKGWKVSQLQEFAHIHFGRHAGLAQQFLFSFQRKNKRF